MFIVHFQLVSKMYTDHASMVWNGEPLQGQNEIAKFIEKLPESEHTIRSLDAHHVNGIDYIYCQMENIR